MNYDCTAPVANFKTEQQERGVQVSQYYIHINETKTAASPDKSEAWCTQTYSLPEFNVTAINNTSNDGHTVSDSDVILEIICVANNA